MKQLTLGLSGYYHDSAACLLQGGEILAAAQEERFTRKKHDARFPRHAVRYCLQEAGVSLGEVQDIVFYDKPILTFDRLLDTYLTFAPRGISSFMKAMPVWLKEKLFLKTVLSKELSAEFSIARKKFPAILFSEHHQSHAASAFFPSPFEQAVVLCMDGVGEWATTSAWLGKGNSLKPLWEIKFPHSLGLLYSAFTYYTGFKVNSGEYKVMGLAPYGKPTFVDLIYRHLIDVKADGTFRLDLSYFDYCTGLRMTNEKFHQLFGAPPRKPESPLTQREMDLARSIQVVTEEVVLRLANKLQQETGQQNICLAGGVALNCVANGRLLREGPFRGVWAQPAAGDAGGALGAALAVAHQYRNVARNPNGRDAMKGAYLGPAFSNDHIRKFLLENNIPHREATDEALVAQVAADLASEKVVGWLNGRMEFGPRALGGRSILGDPRSPRMQSVMNLKIKFRESFRPFAPSVLHESVADYFDIESDSPYMMLVADVTQKHRREMSQAEKELWGLDLLNIPKSDIPAVTHVDHSARIQTVHPETNPRYYALLKKFNELTGCPILINTSFNVRGEPIVCTPEDAYRCFLRTDMDTLVLQNFILDKSAQPKVDRDESWKKEFELD